MATPVTHQDYKNVIGCWGHDVVDPENKPGRENVRAFLFSADNPLGTLSGEVDFVVLFLVCGVASPALPIHMTGATERP